MENHRISLSTDEVKVLLELLMQVQISGKQAMFFGDLISKLYKVVPKEAVEPKVDKNKAENKK